MYRALVFNLLITFLFYTTLGTNSTDNCIYGETKLKWIFYFEYMLIGVMCGTSKKNVGTKILLHCFLLTVYLGLYFFFCAFKYYPQWDALQLVSLLPLAGVVYEIWVLCNCRFCTRCYESIITGNVIRIIGGLCLEIYLVHLPLLKLPMVQESLNHLFPLNIVVFFVITIITDYLLRCLSHVFSQTFNDGKYDWSRIIQI